MNAQASNKKIFAQYVSGIKSALKESKLPYAESDITKVLGMSLDDFKNGLDGNISKDRLQNAHKVSNDLLWESRVFISNNYSKPDAK